MAAKGTGIAVYPRLCGGTGHKGGGFVDDPGLSPPVRGNRGGVWQRIRRMWSIPACAGEPVSKRKIKNQVSVYPRLCGGTGFRP